MSMGTGCWNPGPLNTKVWNSPFSPQGSTPLGSSRSNAASKSRPAAQAGAFESEADRADGADEDEAAGPDGRPLRDLLDSVRGGGRS